MSWSADSELLAVMVQSGSQQLLQLWHRSNWHWYLQREEHWPLHVVRAPKLVSLMPRVPRFLCILYFSPHLADAAACETRTQLIEARNGPAGLCARLLG